MQIVMTLDARQAPDVRLLDAQGQRVSLRRWRGRPLVLLFLRWLG